MEDDKQLRDVKGRFKPKKNPKKHRIRVTDDERRLIESLRLERIDVNTLLWEKSQDDALTTPMRLIPNVLLRADANFQSLIVETVQGEYSLDLHQLEEVTMKLTNILETMEFFDTIKFAIPSSVDIELEADLEAIQQELSFQPIQHVLRALKFMNKLDDVILLSLEDSDFLINASEAEEDGVLSFIHLLEKSKDLRLLPDVTSEITRLGSMMVYKSRIPPHYLLLLISSDPNALLETRNLHEIEETILLLSNQLVTMLRPFSTTDKIFTKPKFPIRKAPSTQSHYKRSGLPSDIQSNSSEYLFKVIIVGESLDLIAQMVHLEKEPKIHPSPLGYDYKALKIKIGQSNIKLMLFSQPSTPRVISREIIDKYYNNFDKFKQDYREYHKKEYGGKLESPYSWFRGASFCIITYDKSDRDSFYAVKDWYKDIRTHILSQDIPIALVGFITNSEEIFREKGQELADELGLSYFETKPTEKRRVFTIYKTLVRKILENRRIA